MCDCQYQVESELSNIVVTVLKREKDYGKTELVECDPYGR